MNIGEKISYWWFYKLDDGWRITYALAVFLVVTLGILIMMMQVQIGFQSKCLIPTPAREYETK